MFDKSIQKKLYQLSLDYHKGTRPGKIEIRPHKNLLNDMDLSLAYSPGVVAPVQEIFKKPEAAYDYTAKGNLVAVITNGSAVLGVGDVGPLAAKPVMEGKVALFKIFADVDAFDIEVDVKDVNEFIKTIKNIAKTFGAINLEDISAPNCFEIEERLIAELEIPVFHDDQHGTAVVIAAGLLNAIEIQGKDLKTVKLVCLGAGSAGIATLNLLCKIGLKKENILLVDSKGIVAKSLKNISKVKARYASATDKITLADAIKDADVFIGLARANLVTQSMLVSMADKPIVFALSNPDPEISPELAHECRDDLIMATGRSDYPNQINNVLCFPFIFRGALDARASEINLAMKMANVYALRDLAKLEVPKDILEIYKIDSLSFGKDYIIPKPFDSRLINVIPKKVFAAAKKSGVSRL